ncbi:hypothetical protein [Mucilaginibacter paludis]|uniref:Uncharacterized protein n=1 Tax=Mucilaginibacter paludis DSM 18603 TaxID=714943 RepID=H1Y471_9SPHI|nr:hypothetical protein [Mucilaginibacter paludis]EHQ24807.1 hypothetical protein Mucpa_0618 [Mucilaginibacter paludis DSM 18603]
MRQAKTTFINLIRGIFLVKKRDDFAVNLLPLIKPISKLAKQESNSSHLVSNPAKNLTQKEQPFVPNINASPFKPAGFSPEEAAVDEFFSNVQFEQVKDELNRWFFFGLAGHGKQIADLTPEQVECFKRELPQLISALYKYHRSTRKEAGNDA